MKNIKKFSLILAIVLIISVVFSVSTFAHDSDKYIEENNKIYATIPWEYELSVYGDDLAYSHENENYIEFCVDENKFAPEGITALSKEKVEIVFEHYYLNEGDLESLDTYFVAYDKVEKMTANGYNCYYLTGEYAFSEEELDTDFAYYFHACVFATKENIFTIVFESYEKISDLYITDLRYVLSGIVLNGTHFENDKPELYSDHDFSNSPDYDEVVNSVQGDFFGEIFEDDGMVTIVAVVIVLMTIVPTLILIIIAIILIVKYSKNKKKLKQYEMTYGGSPRYNMQPQNYGGYGYNQPVNQPYQPPVNTAYQQNPINQNVPQTPSYVTNALNNLENAQSTQPAQTNLPPEMQEFQNNNENKI